MTAKLDPIGLVRDIRMQAHELVEQRTDGNQVFVLAHFGIPVLDIANWRLEVTGLVAQPRSFTYTDLLAMPARTVESFHQCAGFPRRHDIATRRIANVVWSGVELRLLLDQCGVALGAEYVWSYGYDEGKYEGDLPHSAYVKDMPYERLLQGDVILAYALNGQALSREHGFPVRLIVPGYYGTNSVKWLRRVELADRRCPGLFTTVLYNDPIAKPVWEAGPEAVIVSPHNRIDVSLGSLLIKGWAWGSAEIERVEISTDGGERWYDARVSPRRQWSWQAFEATWTPSKPGAYKLLARATDSRGVAQPMKRARNAVHRVYVQIIP